MTRQFLPDGLVKALGCLITAALGLLALGFLARLAWWLVCLGWGAL